MNATEFEKRLNGDAPSMLALIPPKLVSDVITSLVAAYCTAKQKEKDTQASFYAWIQAEKARVSHDDDGEESAAFDQAEWFEMCTRKAKKQCQDAKIALINWWQQEVDRVAAQPPKTEGDLEQHDSSDCDSGCEDCTQRKRFRAKRCLEAKKNPCIQQLQQLLQNAALESRIVMRNVTEFWCNGYIRKGVFVNEATLVTVEFLKKKQMRGILWNVARTKCVIMYTGVDIFWNADPKDARAGPSSLPFGCIALSSYPFPTRTVTHGAKRVKTPDKSAATSVHVLYKDDIFESYVHDMQGLMIPNDSISQHFNKE